MAHPPVSRAAVAAALADVAAGSSMPEAAAAHGISLATLKRYKAGKGPSTGTGQPQRAQAKRPAAGSIGAGKGAFEQAPPTGEGDESLLDTLADELRYARRQRRAATQDSARRQWSKRIEELVKVIDRLAPPPPVPADAIEQRLRALDVDCIALIEQHLPERIDPREITA